jgi:hypothetical protein
MNLPLWRWRLLGIVGVGVAGLATLFLARAVADGKAPPPKAPNPASPETVMKADRPKAMIEMPAKRILARQTDPTTVTSTSDFVNPKVEPGKVRWRKDFAAACRAAKKSCKPVLLFQMMGKLDDQFC